ncbi:hypothetical protein BH09PSE4_BH09PSE4_00060 [soil metagenome]
MTSLLSRMHPHHQHDWSAWGPFSVVPINYDTVTMVRAADVRPELTPIEAYRWRHCECGMAERETWADHSRVLFDSHGAMIDAADK